MNKLHKTEVDHYENNLFELSQNIHTMRYDKVAHFYQEVAVELLRLSTEDAKRGRVLLASKLKEVSRKAALLEKDFLAIFSLCKPHMKGEL